MFFHRSTELNSPNNHKFIKPALFSKISENVTQNNCFISSFTTIINCLARQSIKSLLLLQYISINSSKMFPENSKKRKVTKEKLGQLIAVDKGKT